MTQFFNAWMIAPFIHDEDTVACAIDDPARHRQVICEWFLDEYRNAAIDPLFDHFGRGSMWAWRPQTHAGQPVQPLSIS
jgi:hypothetical protein